MTDNVYVPRAEYASKPEHIHKYDNGQYLMQPKFNGSYGVLITGTGGEFRFDNRHHEPMRMIGNTDLLRPLAEAFPDSIICGEYMNKYKLNEKGEKWINKYIIFDMIKYQGEPLVGRTTMERRALYLELCELGFEDVEGTMPYVHETSFGGIYVARAYYKHFEHHFSELTKIDMIEGFVGKKKDAKLLPAYSDKNNELWQIKFRKPSSNYKF